MSPRKMSRKASSRRVMQAEDHALALAQKRKEERKEDSRNRSRKARRRHHRRGNTTDLSMDVHASRVMANVLRLNINDAENIEEYEPTDYE